MLNFHRQRGSNGEFAAVGVLNGDKTRGERRLFSFRLLGELPPDNPLFRLPLQSVLGGLAGAGVLFRFLPSAAGGVFAFRDAALEGPDFLLKCRRGTDRRWRWGERAGLEVGLLPVGPVKPDAELPGQLQRR
jgi:hypothetical protein